MPNLETHCEHCLEKIGFECREVHQWMDEPSRIYGGAHRVIRHDKETALLIADMFGKLYAEGIKGRVIAEAGFYDHILLDATISKQKGAQGHPFTPEQLEEMEEWKPKYQQELERLQKQIKELSQLPELSTREMREYVDYKLGAKSDESRLLAEFSLRHWQKFLLSRDMPNREISEVDVNSFIAQLSRTANSPHTRSGYLGQLIGYFKYAYKNENFTSKLKEAKEKADKEIDEMKKNALPLRIGVVKRFYAQAHPAVKVAIRLILLECARDKMEIYDLENISWIQDKNGKYHFLLKKADKEERIDLDEKTSELITAQLNKKEKLALSQRNINGRFETLSRKLRLKKTLTAIDLIKFGRNLHPDDIKELILT